MTELIKETLNEYFSDFKRYHLIILISFSLIIFLIQILQSVWVSKKIENFKADIKKSEIKFSRYHSLQVDALKMIYDKLVSFHMSNTVLFKSKYNLNDHAQFKSQINNWVQTYFDYAVKYNREKILFPVNLKSLVHRTIVDFEKVKGILINERQDLLDLEDAAQGDCHIMYEYGENELEVINKKIDSLKTKAAIKNAENNIKELRKSIEDYFEAMNN